MSETLQLKYHGQVFTFLSITNHQGTEFQIRNGDDKLAVSVLFPTVTFPEFVAENIPELMEHGL